MPGRTKSRLLIFVIAYYAEASLKRVLERIPPEIFDQYDCEILVVDDASPDRTFSIGREYQATHPQIRMTVLRNEYNQGYGGNQKVGYLYAIRQRFDFVAMVHGDGQYAPEELPRLVAPLREGEADAVFGSRMMSWFGALHGGMPLYKFVGNRILTTVQNLLLRSSLTEFHSGYRVYSVATLKTLQFRRNSNDFHFDTEIILQLMNAKARILELAIPTYYGDEICRVNGLRYAKDVVYATAKNVAHNLGVLHEPRLDPLSDAPSNAHYDLKLGFPSSHQWTLDRVPDGARVIDIGAGPGGMASELLMKGCDVAVVDRANANLSGMPVRVITQDLDGPLQFDITPYEYLLLLDIIEHLRDPEAFICALRKRFDYTTRTLIITTPNVAFVVQRLMLLIGQFNYGRAGILDRTHTRLFTFRSLNRLLRDGGLKIREVRGVPAPFPKIFGLGPLSRILLAANMAAIRVSKTLFSYQILIVAETTPDVEFVLEDTVARGGGRVGVGGAARRAEPQSSRAARAGSPAGPVNGSRSRG